MVTYQVIADAIDRLTEAGLPILIMVAMLVLSVFHKSILTYLMCVASGVAVVLVGLNMGSQGVEIGGAAVMVYGIASIVIMALKGETA